MRREKPMELTAADAVAFWAIEYVRSPAPPEGESLSGLLCMPLPWDEVEIIQAAVVIYESQTLAEVGLEHYLAWTAQDHANYRLVALTPRELIEILEARPEGGGFERVAINPILSRYFRDSVGYSAGSSTEEFIDDLARAVGIDCR